MSKPVRAGLVGSQFIASIHAESVKRCADAELFAVASPTGDNARNFAQRFGIAHHFADYNKMLELDELDLVVVAAPNFLHAEITLAAFAAAAGRRVESLDRQALEAFVREQRGRGLAPRSVARSVAAIRGFYRFLVLDRVLASSPADDLRPPRAWPRKAASSRSDTHARDRTFDQRTAQVGFADRRNRLRATRRYAHSPIGMMSPVSSAIFSAMLVVGKPRTARPC
jgi:integrase